MEPLFGGLSDQAQRWIGGRFPFVAGGSAASALFIAIPAVVIFGSPVGDALAATKGDASMGFSHDNFRSPAPQLGVCSCKPPRAASVLTLVGGIAERRDR